MLFKKWQQTCWLHVSPTLILLFRDAEQMQDWLTSPDDGCQKNKLILLEIEFDSMGYKSTSRRDSEEAAPGLLHKPASRSKQKVSRLHKLAMSDVETKLQDGRALFHFKVERWSDVGVTTLVSFASHDQSEVAALRRIMRFCIHMASPQGKKEERSRRRSAHEVQTQGMTEASTYVSDSNTNDILLQQSFRSQRSSRSSRY